MPRVSVGVPVFNGAALLHEALTSLREQTYRDIEFVIFDNGSTDRTAEIAERFVSTDSRFRLLRRATTIPAMQNFKDALYRSDSEFFAWRAYDDLSAPNFFERLSNLLHENSQVDLAIGRLHTFKESKKPQWTYSSPPKIPANRLHAALKLMNVASASWFFGLYRQKRLLKEFTRAVSALPQGWATDHLTIFPLLITGALGATGDTHFMPRSIRNPGKTPWVPPVNQQWQIRRTFHRSCLERIEETDYSTASKLILKVAARRHSALRTFRVSQLLVRTLTGSAVASTKF